MLERVGLHLLREVLPRLNRSAIDYFFARSMETNRISA
jgi:hypothetical protein